jgi:hypothetical protein
MMKLSLLKYKTRSYLKNNTSLRTSLPYRQAHSIGIVFTVEDKQKHEDVKEFVRRLELEGKQVRVMSFLPKNKDNYDFLFDFFTEKDVNFWGALTSDSANSFADAAFDFLLYLDTTPNPHLLNILARSKARCRVGKFFTQGEPYFEFMLEVKDGTKSLIDSIHRYTSKLR